MLAYIEKLKQEHSDDESLVMFNEIENALTEKRYGLVFEEHSEAVDEMLKENIPVFTADLERRICKDETLPWNFIIEGDNLQALYLLEKTHKGKIDCIYIDPPYNTGARDWKYNNDYVVSEDAYRHSKWISFMASRLEIAKKLLKPDGALITTIDDNEFANLYLLISSMFPTARNVVITIQMNPGGTQGKAFSVTNEYAIVTFFKDTQIFRKKHDGGDTYNLRRWGSTSNRYEGATCFYPVILDSNNSILGFGEVIEDTIHPISQVEIQSDGTKLVWPLDVKNTEKKWRYARDTVESVKSRMFVEEHGDRIEVLLRRETEPPKTVWTNNEYNAEAYGTKLIKEIIGKGRFSYPKSLYATKDCLSMIVSGKPNAVILDFFAGSGTTMHATNLLNAEDGGNRRCIMVTNNELSEVEQKEFTKRGLKPGDVEWESHGIAKYVTWPRTKCSIEGKDINGESLKGNYIGNDIPMADGFKTNVKYYKCDWIPRIPQDENLTDLLLAHVREMIELEHSIEIDGKNYVVILTEAEADKLEAEWGNSSGLRGLFISRNVLLTTKQQDLFSSVEMHTIPDYYFDIEMKEVGESW